MKCPQCEIPLLMTERKGVEIDYCSQCRGVWLDKGELDKIIELTLRENAPDGRSERSDPGHSHQSSPPQMKERGYSEKSYRGDKRKKKSSLFGELFDMFES